MEFYKNELINETLDTFVGTWSHLLDSGDFIDSKFLKKIDKYIYKNLVKKFKEIEIYNLLILKDKGIKLGFFDRLRISFSGLEPVFNVEQKELTEKEMLQCELENVKLQLEQLLKKRKKKKVQEICQDKE